MKHLLLHCVAFSVLITLFSCKQKQVEIITMNNTRPIEELKELVLMKGDTIAYNELVIAFLNEKHEEENLIYSLIMAHRYNYPPAYSSVYFYLETASEAYGRTMDEKTKEMAIEYLEKGAELKDCSALLHLGSLYEEGKYVQKDTVMSRKLEEEFYRNCNWSIQSYSATD